MSFVVFGKKGGARPCRAGSTCSQAHTGRSRRIGKSAQRRNPEPPIRAPRGAEGRIWTADSLIFSQVLYQAELPRRDRDSFLFYHTSPVCASAPWSGVGLISALIFFVRSQARSASEVSFRAFWTPLRFASARAPSARGASWLTTSIFVRALISPGSGVLQSPADQA